MANELSSLEELKIVAGTDRKKKAKIFEKLKIPSQVSWGGFSYYRLNLQGKMDEAPDRKEIYKFFWQSDPTVTFDAQVSLHGENTWWHRGRYQNGQSSQNAIDEQHLEYLRTCAQKIAAIVKVNGGKITGINSAFRTVKEKKSNDNFDRGLLTDFCNEPPIHYVEIRANADTFRVIAMHHNAVEAIQLIRRPSNAPVRNNPAIKDLRNFLTRDDKSDENPSP